MSTSRRNRNKFTIRRIITHNNTCATLKNTNVLTIYRRSDGGAVIRNLIHRYIRALHEATKMIGCDIYYYDPYKATITMTTRLVNIIIPRDIQLDKLEAGIRQEYRTLRLASRFHF